MVAWQGVRKADTFGSSCMQPIVDERKPWTYEFMTHTDVSEDCLFLNVWTAAKSPSEKRPVYVYIHGGGNTEGSGAVPVYDGEGLARKGIVVVTVNYRLGVLGFFTHPELTKESDAHASGNYALLDLIAALRWVQESIAAFGGDPANVTVGGQSAGASNTHSLTASPLAKGLFHRAIAESGSSVAAGPGTRTLAEQEQLGVKFAEAKGALACRPPGLVVEGSERPGDGCGIRDRAGRHIQVWRGGRWPCAPRIGGRRLRVGKQNDVPTLTGANKHEGGATPHPEITQRRSRNRPASGSASSPMNSCRSIPRQPTSRHAWSRTRARGIRRVSRCTVGDEPRQDGENEGLHLLLGSSAAGPGCREVRGLSHVGGSLRHERARDVESPVHRPGPPDCRHAVLMLGELHQDRRPERPGLPPGRRSRRRRP